MNPTTKEPIEQLMDKLPFQIIPRNEWDEKKNHKSVQEKWVKLEDVKNLFQSLSPANDEPEEQLVPNCVFTVFQHNEHIGEFGKCTYCESDKIVEPENKINANDEGEAKDQEITEAFIKKEAKYWCEGWGENDDELSFIAGYKSALAKANHPTLVEIKKINKEAQ